ncbi:MAG TPA: hypothetical protein VFE51_00680 [Verrucomicrobiae bacterium]|nr:hypothetical protein [Verrucomicrobiae bacterium]
MRNTKHTLVCLSACLALAVAIADQAIDSSVFQLRLVADTGSEAPTSSRVERMNLVNINNANGRTNQETLYIEKAVLLDGHDLKDTHVVTDTLTKQAEIAFELSAAGQKRFAEVTRQHIGKRLAIVIDGQVCSAPVIQSEITGGKGQISGNFTQEQARELSNKINRALKK